MRKLQLRLGILLVFGVLLSLQVQAADWSHFYAYNPWLEGTAEKFDLLSTEEKCLIEEAGKVIPENSFFKVIKNEGTYFLHAECVLDFWIWDGKLWQKQDSSDNVGNFCGSFHFQDQNQVYTLGKYGFWSGHLDLVKTTVKGGKAEWVKTENQPVNFRPLGIYQIDRGIVNLFGMLVDKRQDLYQMNSEGYFLDWETKSWSPIRINWQPSFLNAREKTTPFRLPHYYAFDLEDYGVLFTENYPFLEMAWYILDKKTLELHQVPAPIYYFSKPFSLLVGKDNSFWLTGLEFPQPVRFEIENLLAEGTLAAKLEIEDHSFVIPLSARSILILEILLFLSLVLGFGWLIQKKEKTMQKQMQTAEGLSPALENELQTMLHMLLQHEGKVFTQQELDEILGIHQLKNHELRKVKRARLIKRINTLALHQLGKELILRVRNEEDRRMIAYRILDPSSAIIPAK